MEKKVNAKIAQWSTKFKQDIVNALVNNSKDGEEEINISVDDGEGGIFNGAITVTVNSVNDAPYANDILISTEEDQEITYNFSSDDVDDYIGLDIDNGAMTYSIIDNSLNGNVINNDNGSFTYTPNENYYGQDTFTFIAIDDKNLSSENVALVTIALIAVAMAVASASIAASSASSSSNAALSA